MKYILIAVVLVVGFMIATGNMGGAKKATSNYHSVMSSH